MMFLRILLFALFIITIKPANARPDEEPEKEIEIEIDRQIEKEEKSSRVLEKCSTDSNCPPNSFCARRGCDGMICMCNIGHQPSQDFTECHRVVELYRPCADEKSRCRGPLTFCEHFSKTCHCIDGYIPARDNIRCKKMARYGISFAMLGETCKNGSINCQDTNQQVCSADTSKCTCREGLKPASNIDLNAEPFILDECRPADFSLEVELKECKKPVIIGIALIRQACITDNNCPDNSKCKQMGCDKRECRCVNGTAPTANMENCKPAVTLHHACNGSVVCLGAYVGCIQGKCSCSHGAVEAIDAQCKSAPLIPGKVEFAALGEKCDDSKKSKPMKLCESAICRKGICHCPESMREMSLAEKLENPDVSPPCISIHELTEELSSTEYKLKCEKKKDDLNGLNDTGVAPGVTARWPEEPLELSTPTTTKETLELSTFPDVEDDLELSTFSIAEDNQESSEIEVNETVTIEANEPDTNRSVDLLKILVGKPGNNTEEIIDRLSSLNESLNNQLRNVSLGLTSTNESSPVNNGVDLEGLNNTLNFLLTNDFDAADFNESFDADYLSDDDLETPDKESNENGTIEENAQDVNNTVNLFRILVGKQGNDTEELMNRLSSLNGSVTDKLRNVSMGLLSANESLPIGNNADLNSLNDTLNFLLTNDFDAADFNESFDAEFLPDEDADFDSGNYTSLNESLDLGSLNGTSLNESLDLGSLNGSSLNESLDLGSLNSSSLNESLDLGSLNNTSLNESQPLISSNESKNANVSTIKSCELLSNNSVIEDVSNNSSTQPPDLNEMTENGDMLLDELNQNESDLASVNETAVTGNPDLFNTTDAIMDDGDFEQEFESMSLNDTLVNNTTGEVDYSNINVTPVDYDNLDAKPVTGTSNTTGLSGTLSKDGGMEEALLEESPDLGLDLAADDSHFIGSSGNEIKPISYNDSADQDVAEVAEIVSEGNFTNRMVLEKCDINDVCPTLSQCLDVGCGDPVCFCIYPYGPSQDRSKCIPESNPPESCEELSNYQNIEDDTSFADTVPVVVATTLVCLGLVLVLVVIFIYARLNL